MGKKHDVAETDTDFLKSIRDISFVIAIFLYFSGWIYVYSYYDYFGLSIRDIDVEFYYFLVYSLNVMLFLVRYWFYTLPAIALLIGLAWLLRKRNALIYGFFAPLLFAITYLISFQAGHAKARQQRVTEASSLIPVRFIFSEKFSADTKLKKDTVTPNIPQEQQDFMKANRDTCLLLLASGKDEYYVLAGDDSLTSDNEDKYGVKVYTVRKEAIKLAIFMKP